MSASGYLVNLTSGVDILNIADKLIALEVNEIPVADHESGYRKWRNTISNVMVT